MNSQKSLKGYRTQCISGSGNPKAANGLCLGEHPEVKLLSAALGLFVSPGIHPWLLAEMGYLVRPDVLALAALKLP